MIDDEERQRRIMELAKELGLNRWERKKIEKATEENLTKQFADSASMLEDILQAMSAEMRADEDKKGETEWQSAESPQQRSQN
jgi:CRISPR/Cas system Type II protein with McrA/HNH and RuvC-like nuclease domain